MEPGGLFLASGSALARQEAARRPNRQEKRDQDRPKSTKSRFQANLGGARSAKVAYADYGDYPDNRAKRRFRRINVRFRVATGGTYRGGTRRLPQPRNPLGPMGSADSWNTPLSLDLGDCFLFRP